MLLCSLSGRSRSILLPQAKDEINVPIALSAFRDNNIAPVYVEEAFISPL